MKLLLLLLLNSCWTTTKRSNILTKKPEYLEINSIALDLAKKKVKGENYFLEVCNSLARELDNQNIKENIKFDTISQENIEKILNIIKQMKDEVRWIQTRLIQITSSFAKEKITNLDDSYLDDASDKNIKKENIFSIKYKNTCNFNRDDYEYMMEHKTEEKREEIRNKILKGEKLIIPLSEIKKIDEVAIKNLKVYYRILDIITFKIILDNMQEKSWKDKKINFNKEFINYRKGISQLDEKIASSFQGNVNKNLENSNSKYQKMGKDLIILAFFPSYAYYLFNPYTIAFSIQKAWELEGLIK